MFPRIFAVVAVIFLLLSGTARSNENIVVAYSGVSGFQGPLWTFSELRLFPKYNLNPEMVLIAGAIYASAFIQLHPFCSRVGDAAAQRGTSGGKRGDHRRRAEQVSLQSGDPKGD